MNHEHNDFDSLLENSLQSYANAEPRLGLEERILAQTRVQLSAPAPSGQRRISPQVWGWLAAAAAACAILAAIAVRPHTGSESNVSLGNPPSSVSPTVVATANPGTVQATQHQHAAHFTSPKIKAPPLEQTSQERLLAEFVSMHQKEASMLAREQATLDQPITSSPITSPPIEIRPIQISSVPSRPIVINPIQIDR